MTFDSLLRRNSLVLDNFFNYQFDKRSGSQQFSDPTISLHALTYPDENDHLIAYLAEKTEYRIHQIKLSMNFSDEHHMLIFWSQGSMMYLELTRDLIKRIRNKYHESRVNNETAMNDVAWFTLMLRTHGLQYGWAHPSVLKHLQPTQREKRALIFILAVPQVGLINSIASINLTLAVLGTTMLTPYYVYACHFALTVAICKAKNGGRILSPDIRSIIQYDALAIGAQTFVVTAYASFMMHNHYLEIPSVYKSIQALMGSFKPVIINGIPLDVHLAMIVTSGIVIGAITLYVTWLRNNDNPNFKSRHYKYTLALGFLVGFSIYAATMIPGLDRVISDTTFAGIVEGAAILMYGAALHQLATSTARPALVAAHSLDEQHGPIEPYKPDLESVKLEPFEFTRARSLSCHCF